MNNKIFTLGEIITLFDPWNEVILWVDDPNGVNFEEETPDFKGIILDIPWTFLNYEINTEENRQIRVGNPNCLVFNLLEPKKEINLILHFN